MTTKTNKSRIIEPGAAYRAAKKRKAYPSITSRYGNSNSKEQLDFVVPWQISDNQKDIISL